MIIQYFLATPLILLRRFSIFIVSFTYLLIYLFTHYTYYLPIIYL